MSCFHPLPALKKPYDNTFFIGRENQFFMPYLDFNTGEVVEPIKIPCGKCIGCRLDYSAVWADRCVLEAECYQDNWFLTLTYDDNAIVSSKRSLLTDKNTLTLYPKDLQDFLKRLRITWYRRYNHENIRFYACGEYGNTTARPHYHVLLFNFPIHDLKYKFSNKLGDLIYTSDEIADIWGNGIIAIGKLNWQTAAYTARYVMKKQKGKNAVEFYDNAGIIPEFVRMSRNPGIGRPYYDLHKDEIYRDLSPESSESILLVESSLVLPNGRERPAPKYFDNLYELENPVFIAFLKDRRKKNAIVSMQNKLEQTDLDERGYFQVLEENKKNKIKGLTRFL